MSKYKSINIFSDHALVHDGLKYLLNKAIARKAELQDMLSKCDEYRNELYSIDNLIENINRNISENNKKDNE